MPAIRHRNTVLALLTLDTGILWHIGNRISLNSEYNPTAHPLRVIVVMDTVFKRRVEVGADSIGCYRRTPVDHLKQYLADVERFHLSRLKFTDIRQHVRLQ
jgi:hypothetical protein